MTSMSTSPSPPLSPQPHRRHNNHGIPLSPLDEPHSTTAAARRNYFDGNDGEQQQQQQQRPALQRTTTEPPTGLASSEGTVMERIRRLFRAGPAYTPLGTDDDDGDRVGERGSRRDSRGDIATKPMGGTDGRVMKFEYAVFVILGVAMLWAWNCFLAAAAYFQMRFALNKFILANFQSSVLAVSTVSTLVTTLVLARMQKNASYTYRIMLSLFINVAVFAVLAVSTVLGKNIPAKPYFVFLLTMVFSTSIAQGLIQNGLFSFVSSFGPIYVQAAMSGQGVAGVLPAVTQIVAVLAIPPRKSKDVEGVDLSEPTASPKSAFVYFLTASAVSVAAIIAFGFMLQRDKVRQEMQSIAAAETANPIAASRSSNNDGTDEDGDHASPPSGGNNKKAVSLRALFIKVKLLATALILTFGITMCFPVFTQATFSTHSPTESRLFEPAVFIPLGFLMWNIGDLTGRMVCANPKMTTDNPMLLLMASVCRMGFIPLYMLGNLRGRGAVVNSDMFYWGLQVLFGFTNGWLGSNVMMMAPSYVDDDEKEACGGLMGLCIIAGLASGSLLSFLFNI